MNHDIPTKLRFHKSAISYLEQTGGLTNVLHKCEMYRDGPLRAFHFLVPVEPTDLMDLDSNLGNMVLNQPQHAASIFQEVIFTAIETLKLLPQCSSNSQVIKFNLIMICIIMTWMIF